MRRSMVIATVIGVTVVAGIAASQDWSQGSQTARPAAARPSAVGPSTLLAGSAGVVPTPAGSGSTGPSAGSAASAPAGSAEALAAVGTALAKVVGKNLRFTLGNGISHLDGVYSAASQTVALTRVVDGHRYEINVSCTSSGQLLLGGFTPGGTVLRADSSRLPAGHELLPATAPLVALRLLAGATRAAPAGDDTYTVWLDLTRLTSSPTQPEQRLITEWRTAAGERASQIEATVTVNALGRLAGFRTVFPRADNGFDQGYELAITEADSTDQVSVPAGPVVDAPDSFYHR